MEIIDKIVEIIKGFIQTIKDLVASIRAENDKKD